MEKNKEAKAKPANKDWSFQNLFIGALATACPEPPLSKKLKATYFLKFTKGQAGSFITLYQTRLVLLGVPVRVSGILGVLKVGGCNGRANGQSTKVPMGL